MSVYKVTQGTPTSLNWIDVSNPSQKELLDFAQEFKLSKSAIKDCMDPKHLPKYEHMGSYYFIILRSFDEKGSPEADNVQELTRKIAIFIGKDFILSVHRKDQKYLQELRTQWSSPPLNFSEAHLKEVFLADMFNRAIATYEKPIERAVQQLEKLEGKSFLKGAELQGLIEEAYYLKRQLNVTKRVLRLSLDVLNHLPQMELVNRSRTQDLKENADKLLFEADDIHDNVNTLLNLYISLQSHKTNETMRVLTVMSVIVLPLNLIAGIYGMNFKFMPELEWTLGYPFTIILMAIVGIGIFMFSKKRGWI